MSFFEILLGSVTSCDFSYAVHICSRCEIWWKTGHVSFKYIGRVLEFILTWIVGCCVCRSGWCGICFFAIVSGTHGSVQDVCTETPVFTNLDICANSSLISLQLHPNVRHDLGGLPGCREAHVGIPTPYSISTQDSARHGSLATVRRRLRGERDARSWGREQCAQKGA
jgi:hypothetical protein